MASVVVETARAAGASASHGRVRGDIQALRAFAVAAVVLFHIWPHALTGGYVGVDVFFVISGFLITGQLVRLRERGALRLGEFWASRARRLLPASLLVLAASTVLTLLFAPSTLTVQYLRSIVGSALYVENWVLAADAVDYLGADNAPPVAQHYWSLSVEEQFYVFWPLLIIAVTAAASARVARRRVLIFAIGSVTAASLAYSIWATFSSPSLAYFATPARIWEFGLGALVALLPSVAVSRLIGTIAWIGSWAALILSALLFNAATPFPGYAAILPVAATAALIAIGPEAPFGFARVQNTRVVRWIGDNSYGIYLWHWPLIVIAPAALGHTLDFWENVLLASATVVLASMSKRYVEDPVRFGRARSARPRTVLIATALGMTAVVAAAGVPLVTISAQASADAAQAQRQIADPALCRGASLMLDPACATRADDVHASSELIPSLTGLYDDTGGAFACYTKDIAAPIDPCTIGSREPGAKRIALTGDSHAAMLVPAIRDIAEAQNWSVDVYVGQGCAWSSDPTPSCSARLSALDDALLTGDYDAVIITAWNRADRDLANRQDRAAQFAAKWQRATAAGITVIPILDNPEIPKSAAECLASTTEFTLTTCAFTASTEPDPLQLAAATLNLGSVDLGAAYCGPDGSCPMVSGGVVIYRDLHHITASFSHSLAPYLAERLVPLLDRPGT